MTPSRPLDLPPYHPQGTESITDIPERFLVDGYLKLRADGVWLFRGEKIEHPGLQQFLSQQLWRTQEGRYWVVNGPQRAFVELEDTPYLVKRIVDHEPLGAAPGMCAILNDGSEEPFLPEQLWMNEVGVLYTRVKSGQQGDQTGQGHIARISADALLDLEPLFCEVDTGIALVWNQHHYSIPVRSTPPSIL